MSHLLVGRYQTASGVESGGELLVQVGASRGRRSVGRWVGRSIDLLVGRPVRRTRAPPLCPINTCEKVPKRTDIIPTDRFGPPNGSAAGVRRVENRLLTSFLLKRRCSEEKTPAMNEYQ